MSSYSTSAIESFRQSMLTKDPTTAYSVQDESKPIKMLQFKQKLENDKFHD